MKRPLSLLPLAVALTHALPAEPARAIDAAQIEAIDRLAAAAAPGKSPAAVLASHYAVLLWVEDYCSGRSSQSVRAYLMKKGESDAAVFEDAWTATSEMLGKTDAKAMCALALEQYGPDGALIKGGWAPKE